MMTTTYTELIERQERTMLLSCSDTRMVCSNSMTSLQAKPWWQILTIRTWHGFGMRNLTVRFRGVVVLKLAVR